MERAIKKTISENNEDIVQEVMDKYKEYVSPGLTRLLKVSGYNRVEYKAEGAIVVDTQGKEFIDMGGGYGVFTIGHRHPEVVQAVKEQLDLMPLSPRVLFSRPQAELAELLAQVTPGELRYSFFCNSGAEANEGAIKLARLYTKRAEIISAEKSFHGKTMGALSGSGRKVFKEPFEPLLPATKQVPFSDVNALAKVVSEKTAAVLLEPVQGEGGINVPPEDYLKQVRKICDENGALLILDEVQTGLGRCGSLFCSQHFGVVPDIMTLAKALGGGVIPIGALIGTPKVWGAFKPNPLIHTSTFGGNPLACTAAKKTLEIIIRDCIPEKAKEKGNYLKEKLNGIKAQYPEYITEVRGLGLMIGLEFTNEGIGGFVIPAMAKDGVTAIYTLNNPKVLRFEPPVTISKRNLDKAVQIFDKAMQEVKTKYSHLFKSV